MKQISQVLRRTVVLSLEEVPLALTGGWDEIYGVQGERTKILRSLSEAEDFFSTKKLVWAALAPSTIGDLKRGIACMDDEITVFAFAYGNKEGHSSWKRKQTWKQWLKLQ